jgi:hypothetical protein
MMDFTGILDAAIRATGGNADASDYDVEDLERAKLALLATAKKIDEALRYLEIASFSMTAQKGDPND